VRCPIEIIIVRPAELIAAISLSANCSRFSAYRGSVAIVVFVVTMLLSLSGNMFF